MLLSRHDRTYFKRAALLYASFRLRTFVLYIGVPDDEFIDELHRNGCTVISFFFQAEEIKTVRTTSFFDRHDLNLLMEEKIQGFEFDTIILSGLQESCSVDLLKVLEVVRPKLRRRGNLIVIDSYLEQVGERYPSLVERQADQALYLTADYLDHENVKDKLVMIKYAKNLSETPRFALGLTGHRISPGDLSELTESVYSSYNSDYRRENLWDIKKQLKKTMAGDFGTWIEDASFALKKDDQMVSGLMVTLNHRDPILNLIFTRPSHRRQGYAAKLLEASFLALKERGFKQLYSFVELKDYLARDFIEAMGFREVGRSIE